MMEISPKLTSILSLVADLSHYNINASVLDTAVIERSGMPASQVNSYIKELDSMGLLNLQLKVSGADFRLLNLTKEGLSILSDLKFR